MAATTICSPSTLTTASDAESGGTSNSVCRSAGLKSSSQPRSVDTVATASNGQQNDENNVRESRKFLNLATSIGSCDPDADETNVPTELPGVHATGVRSQSIASDDAYLEKMDELAITNLERAQSTESIDSTFSSPDAWGERGEQGQLEVRLFYEHGRQLINIWLIRAVDVRVGAALQCADSQRLRQVEVWVVVFLLPHPKPLFRTPLQSCASNPVAFREHFQQRVRSSDVPRIALLCQMYAKYTDSDSPPVLVGQSRLRFKDVTIDEPNTLWLSLLHRNAEEESADSVGQILFSLVCAPSSDRLTVVISKLKSLKLEPEVRSITNEPQVQVRVYLVCGSKVLKKKTSVRSAIEDTTVFNESMIFSMTAAKLPRAHLRVSVSQVLSAAEHRTIGHVTIGSRRSGKQLGHWQQLMVHELARLKKLHFR